VRHPLSLPDGKISEWYTPDVGKVSRNSQGESVGHPPKDDPYDDTGFPLIIVGEHDGAKFGKNSGKCGCDK
jgi:hypothetical protein